MTSAVLSYSQPTDNDLMRRCAAGDDQALRELIHRYQAPVYRFLARRMEYAEDAEDAALETFVRLWKSASRFQFRSSVATWVYKIAINIAHDYHIRQKRRPAQVNHSEAENAQYAVESSETTVLKLSVLEDQSAALRNALATMRDEDRSALVLYYLEDMDYEQIQEILGLGYNVLKTRLARARKRLKSRLEEMDAIAC